MRYPRVIITTILTAGLSTEPLSDGEGEGGPYGRKVPYGVRIEKPVTSRRLNVRASACVFNTVVLM